MNSKVNKYISYTISVVALLCYISLLIFGIVCLINNYNGFDNLKSIWYYCFVNVISFLLLAYTINTKFIIVDYPTITFILNTSILIWGYYELFVFNYNINTDITNFTLITFIIYCIIEFVFLIYIFLHCYAKICLIQTPCCFLFKKCRDNDTPIPDDIELQNLNDN
jgi:hypothetical protein